MDSPSTQTAPAQDSAQTILTPVQADDSVKAQAWDAYHSSPSADAFAQAITPLNLPQEVKAALWDAKSAIPAARAAIAANPPSAAGPHVAMEPTLTGLNFTPASHGASNFTNVEGKPAQPGENAAQDFTSGFVGNVPVVGAPLINKVTGTTPAQRQAGAPILNAAGATTESVAEYMAASELGGYAALKALGTSERLLKIAKAAKFIEDNPATGRLITNAMSDGTNLLKLGYAGKIVGNAAIGTAQSLAHGSSLGEAAISGGVAGAASGLIEGVGAIKNALAPTAKTIADVSVPVRAAAAEPGLVNKLAEFAANKPALQEFDVTQTQAAARDVIHSIAADTIKSSTKALPDSLLRNFYADMTPTFTAASTDAERDAAITKAQNSLALVKKVKSTVDNANPKDFGEVATVLKKQILGPMYNDANKAGDFVGKSYNEWAQEEEAAFRRGDVAAENAAHANKQAAFIAANGKGVNDPVNKLYAAVDDFERIQKVLNTSLRPTPAEFLNSVTTKANPIDPQIIDGLALRKAVNRLSTDGTFAKAGITPDTASKLQELGALLERSKVQEGAKRGIYSAGKAGATGATVGLGLDMILAHAATAGAATSAGALAVPVGAAGAGAYGMNRLLGYLMTNPAALDYTLKAARTLVPPVASQAVHYVFDQSKEPGKELTPAR